MTNQKDPIKSMDEIKVWTEYYNHFSYFNPKNIREGCHPRIMDWPESRDNAIVLIHGLTDSPYFMEAIGKCFYQVMGFNVFIPLLQGHGLKHPQGMKGVSLDEWKRNVEYAVAKASEKSERVSIGGLSTGGALSVYMAYNNPSINGVVFLFSAALDIAGKTGNLKERLLRTPIARILDFYDDRYGTDLIGDNPYRYSRMDKGGARQLSKLIKAVDKLTGARNKKQPLRQPFFVAHSEYDKSADIQGVEELLAKSDKSKTGFFRIGKYYNVPHASIVLEKDVIADNGSPLEPKNPFFDEMMNSVYEFAKQHLSVKMDNIL